MIRSKLKLLWRQVSYAKAVSGRGIFQQLRDLKYIRTLPGHLSTSDYYDLRLFNQGQNGSGAIEEYYGWRMDGIIDNAFNYDIWRAVANDKILSYSHLATADIPIPETVALYSPDGRTLSGSHSFREPAAFIEYLRNEADFPLFFKPNYGSYGRSSFAIKEYDSEKDCWNLSNGDVLTLEQLTTILNFVPYKGVFLQKLLRSHEAIRELIGDSVACVRLSVMRNEGKPFVFNAFWKIPSGKNMTDNFHAGRSGNLLSYVDAKTGKVGRVITGLGIDYNEIDRHPDTNQIFTDFQLPDYDKAVDIICQGAISHEGLNLQHWDVVLTDNGPVAMEVNLESNLHIMQVLNGSGLYNDMMKDQLAKIKAAEDGLRAGVSLRDQRPDLKL